MTATGSRLYNFIHHTVSSVGYTLGTCTHSEEKVKNHVHILYINDLSELTGAFMYRVRGIKMISWVNWGRLQCWEVYTFNYCKSA